MFMTRLWISVSSSWALYSVLYYAQLYGIQIVVLTVLGAITVFRREMSCNHVYQEDETDNENDSESELSDSEADTDENNVVIGQMVDWDGAEHLLEGAGMYCSGEPLLAFVNLFGHSISEHTTSASPLSSANRQHSCCDFEESSMYVLPPDVLVHALSFLPPRDIVSFGCTSKSCRDIIDRGDTSMVLWKMLWFRDYAWVVTQWDIGREAMARSGYSDPSSLDDFLVQHTHPTRTLFDKNFYFIFGQCYVNYVLAGHNTHQKCLVGLHGHVFDITDFLEQHPGSPDTLLVHSGRDTTTFFEDMGHSIAARKLSSSMCLVVDASCIDNGDCGAHPTKHFTPVPSSSLSAPVEFQQLPCLLGDSPIPSERRSKAKRPVTLQKIRTQYQRQQQQYAQRMEGRIAASGGALGSINVYYDPFRHEWKAWYIDDNFENVFVENMKQNTHVRISMKMNSHDVI